MSAPVLLAESSGLSMQQIKLAMQKGAVWLRRGRKQQRLRRAKKPLSVGDELVFYYDPEVLNQQPPTIELVADHQQYSIWFKPYGVFSSGSRWADHCAMDRLVEQAFDHQRPVFLVHRLDRATSGLMVLAHTREMARVFAGFFEQRTIRKVYRAIVHGDAEMFVDSVVLDEPVDGKSARSIMERVRVDSAGLRAEVSVELKTGRKHQIRHHLAHAGYPIVGDRLFGRGEEDGQDLQLQARFLAFTCPVTLQPVSFTLPEAWRISL
ncbi:tRNA pseudouridine synthase C [BD1-7 clade bacterium]|uniref:tRNA pseudouridine synthase C n=1 Tax=BD1-7 clade bacterium TaxID=2029982 RepID=A0A5S9N3Z3_9GAMM|nr:tRNA pseudouridine synthase C [BD1-7 clade bacterium]